MADALGYVVACLDQASGQVEDTLSSQVLHPDEDGAGWERDLRGDEAAEAGRGGRYVVCRVAEVEGTAGGG